MLKQVIGGKFNFLAEKSLKIYKTAAIFQVVVISWLKTSQIRNSEARQLFRVSNSYQQLSYMAVMFIVWNVIDVVDDKQCMYVCMYVCVCFNVRIVYTTIQR